MAYDLKIKNTSVTRERHGPVRIGLMGDAVTFVTCILDPDAARRLHIQLSALVGHEWQDARGERESPHCFVERVDPGHGRVCFECLVSYENYRDGLMPFCNHEPLKRGTVIKELVGQTVIADGAGGMLRMERR